MNESPATGSTDQFRKSDFVSATETLAGKTRRNPAQLILARPVFCNGVISIDGKQEDGVPAAVLETASGHEMPLRMRLNATKRRMLAKASGTNQMKEWAPLKLKLRLYQTVDKGPGKGSPVTDAIGMDVLCVATGCWLRYYDFQQRAGRHYVEESGLDDNWRAMDLEPEPRQATAPEPEAFAPRMRDATGGRKYGEIEPGIWVDANGEHHDPERHSWSATNGGQASYTKDGEFRAKRGYQQQLESAPAADPIPGDADPVMTDGPATDPADPTEGAIPL